MHISPSLSPTSKDALSTCLSIVVSIALCCQLLPICSILATAQAADTGSGKLDLVVDGDTQLVYGQSSAPYMYDAASQSAIICAQPSLKIPSTGAYTKDYEGIDTHIEETGTYPTWISMRSYLVRALTYYTHPDSPGFDAALFPQHAFGDVEWTREGYLAVLHLSLSSVYDNAFEAVTQEAGDDYTAWAARYITGGFAMGDEVDGDEGFYADSVWGRLLDYDGLDHSDWNSDENPYYGDLPRGFAVYVVHTGSATQDCIGFDAQGWIELEMASDLPAITEGNRAYSCEGATWGIYSDGACSNPVAEMACDAGGTASSTMLLPGTYWVKPLDLPACYAACGDALKVEVSACAAAALTAEVSPRYSAPTLIAQKANAETGSTAAVAGATLQGARVEVAYYDGTTDSAPARTWTFMTDADGAVLLDAEHLVSGDSLYLDAEGTAVLPIGSYTFTETDPSQGFRADSSVQTIMVSGSGDQREQLLAFGQTVTIADHVIRGDLEFTKVDDAGNILAGIPFLLSYDNGEEGALQESHVIVTDENGHFSSAAAAHSHSTDVNDAALSGGLESDYSVDEDALDAGAGVWFSMDADGLTAEPDDTVGALPYGSYSLVELACDANFGMTLVDTTFTVSQDGITVTLDDLVDKTPQLDTFAYDATDGDKYLQPAASATVEDTVHYRNLIAGAAYELVGSVVMAESGTVIATHACDLAPDSADGSLTMSLSFDSSALPGATLVVFETLTLDGKEVASHADLADADQSVQVLPTITTNAVDKTDGDKYITSTEAVIVDTVSYEGLEAGSTYKLDALLMDKSTGNVARDAQGDAISASREFVPDEKAGDVEMEIALDTTVVGGHDVVVYETLLNMEDFELAAHEDLEDSAQTLKTVGIDTLAWDKTDADKYYDLDAAEACIYDIVDYHNLEVGATYTLVGTLVDGSTGEAIEMDGEAVSGMMTFTTENADGDTTVDIPFSPAQTDAETVVVYETLLYEGNTAAVHADQYDEDQTVIGIRSDVEAAPEESGDYVETGDPQQLLATALTALALLTLTTIAVLAQRRRWEKYPENGE